MSGSTPDLQAQVDSLQAQVAHLKNCLSDAMDYVQSSTLEQDELPAFVAVGLAALTDPSAGQDRAPAEAESAACRPRG